MGLHEEEFRVHESVSDPTEILRSRCVLLSGLKGRCVPLSGVNGTTAIHVTKKHSSFPGMGFIRVPFMDRQTANPSDYQEIKVTNLVGT